MENIADYIMDALLGKRFMAEFNAIVTSLRYATLRFNESTNDIQISTRGKLFISDGQHRQGGIEKALRRVEQSLDAARDENDTEAMEYWENILARFEEMTIPVVIFTGLTKDEEKQLFHDLNNLGTAVTTTQALHLDQTDPFNRMAKQLIAEIPKLKKYGINTTAKQLSDKKTEVATLAVWNNCIRILLNGSSDAEIKRDWNYDWDYEEKKSKKYCQRVLDNLVRCPARRLHQ